jgi:2-polyprenyl-6-hydroxyphenyl methylase/3-demethylubiquinone-9 3-methyltransferase
MGPDPALTDVDSHFAFGRNWASFVDHLDGAQVERAINGLAQLLRPDEIEGKTFLDIGSGSGLSMLAALRLGAAAVTGVDLDPSSVDTARRLLEQRAPADAAPWSVSVASVFDLGPPTHGTFDVVHSWGVLHHTGDMHRAIETAGHLVAPGGVYVLALYQKTRYCDFWRREKRFYSSAPPVAQAMTRGLYKSAVLAGVAATRRNPVRYLREYGSARGMDFHHDVHDWLGGYPYESIEPEALRGDLARLGFDQVRSFVEPIRSRGLLGSRCDEYVFRRAKEDL